MPDLTRNSSTQGCQIWHTSHVRVVRFELLDRSIYQERNFDGNVFNVPCHPMEIGKTRTTPCKLSSNGQMESLNYTLIHFFRCLICTKLTDFHAKKCLQYIMNYIYLVTTIYKPRNYPYSVIGQPNSENYFIESMFIFD